MSWENFSQLEECQVFYIWSVKFRASGPNERDWWLEASTPPCLLIGVSSRVWLPGLTSNSSYFLLSDSRLEDIHIKMEAGRPQNIFLVSVIFLHSYRTFHNLYNLSNMLYLTEQLLPFYSLLQLTVKSKHYIWDKRQPKSTKDKFNIQYFMESYFSRPRVLMFEILRLRASTPFLYKKS